MHTNRGGIEGAREGGIGGKGGGENEASPSARGRGGGRRSRRARRRKADAGGGDGRGATGEVLGLLGGGLVAGCAWAPPVCILKSQQSREVGGWKWNAAGEMRRGEARDW